MISLLQKYQLWLCSYTNILLGVVKLCYIACEGCIACEGYIACEVGVGLLPSCTLLVQSFIYVLSLP